MSVVQGEFHTDAECPSHFKHICGCDNEWYDSTLSNLPNSGVAFEGQIYNGISEGGRETPVKTIRLIPSFRFPATNLKQWDLP